MTIPPRDPKLAYQRALTAYGAMMDELAAAFRELVPDAPQDRIQRYETALDGFVAAQSLLNQEQYKRIEAIFVSEQNTTGAQLDLLLAEIRNLREEGLQRDTKLNTLLDQHLTAINQHNALNTREQESS